MTRRQAIPCIIGMVVGVAIVIAGFCVMNPSSTYIGRSITFGADFYTDMYSVTRNTGNAINNAAENICKAIGWLIVALGAIDFCYFLSKLLSAKPEKANKSAVPSTPDRSAAPSMLDRLEASKAVTSPRPASAQHTWRCSHCGEMTSTYPCEHCHFDA